jgi:propanol-preferring alcohol dehydrogenase
MAIAWLGYACCECQYCVDGRETLCEAQHNSGYSVDSAFAEYAVASARFVVPVPTERVAVFSIGGLGHLAASSKVFEQALASLRRGGRLICVALPAGGEMNIPIFETVLKGISIIGSIVGTRQDLAEVFALHAAKKTRVIGESRRIEEVNGAIDQVLSGKIPARLVFGFRTRIRQGTRPRQRRVTSTRTNNQRAKATS